MEGSAEGSSLGGHCSLPSLTTEDIQHILKRLHRAQLQIRIDVMETEL